MRRSKAGRDPREPMATDAFALGTSSVMGASKVSAPSRNRRETTSAELIVVQGHRQLHVRDVLLEGPRIVEQGIHAEHVLLGVFPVIAVAPGLGDGTGHGGGGGTETMAVQVGYAAEGREYRAVGSERRGQDPVEPIVDVVIEGEFAAGGV